MEKLKKPKSPKELRYFTRRRLANGGRAMIWVYKPTCPECEKGKLSVPFNKKTGKFKSRSRSLICGECGKKFPKKDFDKSDATANVAYTCPHCGKKGELQKPFKRTKSTKVFKFKCQHCGKTVRVGKMKGKKKKK